MSNTVEALKSAFDTFLAEDAKFSGGNNAAGTRSRKALVKARRNEITAEKNARKEAKAA